jgi:hypothetical protein
MRELLHRGRDGSGNHTVCCGFINVFLNVPGTGRLVDCAGSAAEPPRFGSRRRKHMTERWTSTFAAVAAVPLLVSLMGACGTADTPSNPAASSSASPGKQSFESFDEFQLAFSGCMREHGVDMPDPSGDGSLRLEAGGDMAAFEAASNACREQLGTPPAPKGGGEGKTDEEMLADHLKIAKCLREHGVDVPDPTLDSPIEVPQDVPEEALTTCAPNGVVGRAGGR